MQNSGRVLAFLHGSSFGFKAQQDKKRKKEKEKDASRTKITLRSTYGGKGEANPLGQPE